MAVPTQSVAPAADEADALIAKYEKLMIKFINKTKAAKNGDLLAAAEAAKIAVQLSDIQEKLSDMDLTDAQTAKLSKATAKVAAAAAEAL